ncbi:MAG: DNA internalization-related competence protein ComEC/Rec2 [Chloroflexi bacterium]|nr:DNA internalization-related competence protein ComEC/Rec2 [Chloroflexota bacterium]
MKLAFIVAAWLIGVLIGLETRTPLLPLLLLMGGSISLGLALRLRQLPVFPTLLAVILLLGVWRADSVTDQLQPLTSLSLTGQTGAAVTLEGRISNDPETSGSRVKFSLDLSSAQLESGRIILDDRVLVFADPADDLVARRSPPYFDYGDLVVISGAMRSPEPFGGFDYPAYLASQGISGVMLTDTAKVIGEDAGWREWPYALRGRLSESIDDALPYPQSALGQALLLGLRGDLPPEMVEDFRSTGTSHLLAISGLHVGVLVAMFLAASAWLFGRRGFYFLAVPLIMVWAYALVSGLPPSVVRAAVMGSVYLVAVGIGRPGSIIPALALSAGLMTVVSPEIIQRVSFQLSFAAVAGIALTQPFVPQWSPPGVDETQSWWQPWAFHLGRWPLVALIISRSAMLATWPLLAFNFKEVALSGIIVTVLALPAMPFIMAGTLAAAMVGLISTVAGQFIGWLVWVPATYLIELVQASPDWTLQTDWAGIWLVGIWYAALGVLLLFLRPGRVGRLWALVKDGTRTLASRPFEPAKTIPIGMGAVVMVVAAAILWWQVGSSGDGDLHVHFFDVGQGDSALIVTPDGRQMLVDGGASPDGAIRALSETLPNGDRSLDLVVMTHLDADHSRGLLNVLDQYQVGTVLVGKDAPDAAMRAQWQASLKRNNAEAISLHQGFQVDLGSGVTAEVLNPRLETSKGTSANNDALVLRLAYGSISFLLTADIEAETESYLSVGESEIRSTVLKAAHHGSKSSSTPDFIAAVDPEAVLISVGEDNSFGHPNVDVLGRLVSQTGVDHLYRTDRDGDVEFVTDGQELWVNTER